MALGKVPGGDDDSGADGVFAEINITPLTDIFLVLLIIFMVTSTIIVPRESGGSQTGLKVNLPKAGTSDVSAASTDMPVAVLTDGRIVLEGNVVTIDELKVAFEKAKQKDPLVLVQADEGVHHGKVVEVMQLARSIGLTRLAIATREGQ